jgi:hypothetical protein
VDILSEHRALLADRVERSRQLLRTIDRTIADLKGEKTMNDKDLYHGFAPEKQAEYEDELVERFGGETRQRIEESKAAFAKLGKAGIQAALEEGGKAEMALVELFKAGTAQENETVGPALDRHRAWIGRMWGNKKCKPAAYAGLADFYSSHPDFRTRYEAHGEGFTDWLAGAMKAYAARLA